MLVRYQAEDKANTVQPTATRGVSALLQGTKSAIIPEDSERMARRKRQAHTNGNGHVEELLTLGVRRNGHNGTNGHH
jgi:lysine 2,3-aminomutase